MVTNKQLADDIELAPVVWTNDDQGNEVSSIIVTRETRDIIIRALRAAHAQGEPSDELKQLVGELEAWPATGRGDGLDAAVVSKLLKRASKAIVELAAHPAERATDSGSLALAAELISIAEEIELAAAVRTVHRAGRQLPVGAPKKIAESLRFRADAILSGRSPAAADRAERGADNAFEAGYRAAIRTVMGMINDADSLEGLRQALAASRSPAASVDIHHFVSVYNFCFDDGGIYTPTDRDKAMLEDAINCYVAECEQARSCFQPASSPTIDDVPSCGQENDYRRARPSQPVTSKSEPRG